MCYKQENCPHWGIACRHFSVHTERVGSIKNMYDIYTCIYKFTVNSVQNFFFLTLDISDIRAIPGFVTSCNRGETYATQSDVRRT